MTQYTGICIDGPLVRQQLTADRPDHKVAIHPNSSMRVESEIDLEATVQTVQYHWRVMFKQKRPDHEQGIWSTKQKHYCDWEDIQTVMTLATRRAIMSVELSQNDTHNLRELSKYYAADEDLKHDWDLIKRMWLHIKYLEMQAALPDSHEVKVPLPEFREER